MPRTRRLLIAVLCGLCWTIPAEAQSPHPNIVLIYADDLGWRDLGVMGSRYYETPNLDRLASQGMRFMQAYSNAPTSASSRASLMSGQYTPRHGIYTVASAERGDSRNRKLVPVVSRTNLDLSIVTLAEVLRDAGYATGLSGKWNLGDTDHSARAQGFDWTIAGSAAGVPPSYFYPYQAGETMLSDLQAGGSSGEYLTDRLTREALAFIDTHRAEPFFLYLSHFAVHTPLEAKPELVKRYEPKPGSQGQDNPTYAAMIQSLDESVGAVMLRLNRLGLAERTLVIFTSDNGGYGPATSMEPLRGSKGMLYEGGIRVPLIIRWPGIVAPGSVSGVPVTGLDLYPTLLSVAGAEMPIGQPIDGTNLVPVLRGDWTEIDRPLFWHFPAYVKAYPDTPAPGPWRTTPASAVQYRGSKLIHFFEDGHDELYDLTTDVGERIDSAELNPEKVDELRALLERWWKLVDAFIPTEPNPEYGG